MSRPDEDVKPWAAALALAAVTAVYTLVFFPFYFSRAYIPVHDFNVAFVSGAIVANHLLGGRLPFWSPEQNSGSPLWPDTEVFPGYDPVSLAVNLSCGLFGIDAVNAHLTTVFIWHLTFALGSFFLFRRLGIGPRASVLGFTALLFSSLTVLNFRQADDYVTVYRYVPLIGYAAVDFFERPGVKRSLLLGLAAGLSISGYQTMVLLVVALMAAAAALPLARKGLDRGTFVLLLPGAGVALLMAGPFLVAAHFWVTNVASARELFPWGYRGDLMDFLGPLSRNYPNETIMYVGLAPALLAVLRLAGLVKGAVSGRESAPAYWPTGFVLVLGLLLWIFYIGTPEVLTGVDKPFLFIRSFNNVLPFLMLALVYLALEQAERVDSWLIHKEAGQKEAGQNKAGRPGPVLALMVAAAAATVFAGLSRPSVVNDTLHRYASTAEHKGAMVLTGMFKYLSASHVALWALGTGLIAALALAALKKRRAVFWTVLVALLALELSVADFTLMTRFNGYTVRMADYGMLHLITPWLDAPLPKGPPERRERQLDLQDQTLWFKQGNVLFHRYTASASNHYVWFRTNAHDEFFKRIVPEERLDFLTGVTRPLIYFARRAVPVPREQSIEALNSADLAVLEDTIVVDPSTLGPGMPEELPTGSVYRGEVRSYGPNHISIATEADAPSYLVYLDFYDPWWRATVDGESARIVRANHVFKAVHLPAGRHTVRFSYMPWPYAIALGLKAAAFLACAAFLIAPAGMFGMFGRKKPG